MDHHRSRCFRSSTRKCLKSIRWVRKPTFNSISFTKVHRTQAKLWNTQQRATSYSKSLQTVKVLSKEIEKSYSSVHRSQELDILYDNQDSKLITSLLIERIIEL